MENSEPKKSKQVSNSDLSDVESMHSAPSIAEEESEIETNSTNTSTKPETAQTEENNDSDPENNNGFTVVTRKRVPPIVIDESMNTPELLKELSEKTDNKSKSKKQPTFHLAIQTAVIQHPRRASFYNSQGLFHHPPSIQEASKKVLIPK
ncbi:hypothetical protein NPIL_53271 [Nephila pilipes]|uniref:Uncharacterized protein n=1 Tax=Nephila pilipes TaxID=299642 RepID=A0A8X6K4V4_NEPPI|nr:hypothetical protein NPIL_53271 [Nephila pilipes]